MTASSGRTISRSIELAVDLAKRFEGCERIGGDGLIYPYYDPIGFPTQAMGRLLSREKFADLTKWPPIDAQMAERWLQEDMGKALASVLRLVPVPLTDEQLAALIDFTFNCGGGNLQISTLRKMCLRGEMEDAADEFPKWCYAGGVKLAGLVRRRYAERSLFLRGGHA